MPQKKTGTVLHELLAVEQGLSETSNRLTKEVTKTLSTKAELFKGQSKEHEIFGDDQQHLKQATQYNEIQSTVDEQLDFLGGELTKYWDVSLQKEEANQRAKENIIVNGKVLAADVPSIVLLSMEKKLGSLLAVYNAIPTLDAATTWEPDPNAERPNVFRTKHATERQQTVTSKKYIEISPATVQHKAQIAQQEIVEVVGKYKVTEFSSAISSFEKAARIQRLTTLIRAVKKARQRANNVDVNNELAFGKELLNFING